MTMGKIQDDETIEEERVFIERRAATSRWWGGLIGLEVMVLALVFGLLSFDYSPPRVDGWTARILENLEQVARAIQLVIDDPNRAGRSAVPSPDTSEQVGVDPLVALTLLTTLGVATTVAMGSALERMERAREQFLRTEKPTASAVFQLRNAEIGQVVTFIVTMLALVIAHGMVAAAVLAMNHPDEASRHLSWVVAVSGLVMAVFFLAESARLSATAFRSPLQTRPRGGERAVAERLERGLVRWMRQQPARPSGKGRRGGGWRQIRNRARQIVAGAVIVLPFAWFLVPELLGAGVPSATSRNTPPAIFLSTGVVLAVIGFLAARIGADSLRDRGAMWWATVIGASLLFWLGGVVTTSAIILGFLEEDVWRGSAIQGVVVGLLWLALLVMLYERVLGWAGLGSRRDLGLRLIVETRSAVPPRWKVHSGPRAWWARVAFIAIALGVQVMLALAYTVPVHGGAGGTTLPRMTVLILGIGLGSMVLSSVAISEFARPTGAHRPFGTNVWHGERVWQIGVLSALVVTIGLAQVGRGAIGLTIVPWAVLNLALLIGSLGQLSVNHPLSFLGRWRWFRRCSEKLRQSSLGRSLSWVRDALKILGDQRVGARMRHRRRWIARGLAPDDVWEDKDAIEWARKLVEDAQVAVEAELYEDISSSADSQASSEGGKP